MVESLPMESENPAGMSEAAALFVTPVGHSLVTKESRKSISQQTDHFL